MPAGLWVVATPIGNLMDMTQRARQALQEAEVILCEDTRRTAKLLAGSGIHFTMQKLERLDAYATDGKMNHVIQRLTAANSLQQKSFALVTDAGTPAVSDPGAKIVALAHQSGIRITPLPGPSAVMTLLSVSGFEETSFLFRGYFPRHPKQAEEEMQKMEQVHKMAGIEVYVWFESPERIQKTLEFLEKYSENIKKIVIGKELTKIHEKIYWGDLNEAASQLREELREEGFRGEWVFAVHWVVQRSEPVNAESTDSLESLDWVKALHCLLNVSIPASEAARQVSQFFRIPRNEVYEVAQKIFQKKFLKGG